MTGTGLRALLEDIAKTSQPETWHTPREKKIRGKVVPEIEVLSYHNSDNEREIAPKAIKSTVYNPVRGEQVDWKSKYEKLSETSSDMLILPALQNYDVPMVNTKFGKHCKGSTLSYQQPIESDCIINIYDGIDFPELPLKNFMNNNYQTVLSISQTVNVEGLTLSLQEINKFDKHRITASQVGDIYKRRKDFETLTDRLKSTRNVTTAALRRGLACEPVAVSAYSRKLGNKVNLFSCGVVVSFSAPWLAASPDRNVYNPERNPPFGLLEIKCPSTSSVLERNHSYYYQVLSQLAATGLTWCDLYIWCENDDHLETIHFDNMQWQQVKDRLDEFFFSYYLARLGFPSFDQSKILVNKLVKAHQDENFSSSTSFINMLDNITQMFFFFAIFVYMQLLLSGDIELNHGPSFIDDFVSSLSYTSSSSFMSDTFVHEDHNKCFSIVHLNVQNNENIDEAAVLLNSTIIDTASIGIPKKIKSTPHLLSLKNQISNDPIDVTNIFNENFSSQSYINDDSVPLPSSTEPLLDNISLLESDVRDILLSLDTSKAVGPNGIHPRFLKEVFGLDLNVYNIISVSEVQHIELANSDPK
ncbi:hypothetical protein KUTeg_002180, partial [Tegillarca granosa]